MGANNHVVTLSFNADTSQAKKEIQGLISELNSLSTKKIATSFSQDIGQDVKIAAQEVGKFSTVLKEATNIDTGKLDLSKLNKGLKDANTSLPKMASSFKALGSDGVKAFADVVKQINAAEVPLKKTNAMVDKLWTSMKNTVNWQISSSALHGLMSGIQGAFRYAQDLNTSLNNIRIITGANVEEMAAFAVEANKAAKALSTTTTAYSDASLIYFQQGLSKEEVKERADVTIKMANVTRQSATEVSNQLTAIWNNFDDGTKSLEYYADVLTKLGATTASSTDEIAGGLEKFAAIADTIGLSYEYAASALATITSNTRQSEEVVGTALKTIFARIQGLNLGETLDDGTTLNKYSEALNKVGISIFNANGEIKNMDILLDEMANKWTSISNAQQIALAQTVAGTRQYTQLVALMDNWNNGDADSMTANLATSYGATGALQEQADIYADSWEAAQKRVQASAESLYQSLINDDFFIDLLNSFSKFIDFIKQAIDGLGGMKGLLATISTYILTIARTKFSDELKRLTGPSQKQQAEQAMQMKRDANTELKNMAAAGGASKESQVTAQTYGKVASIQEKLLQNADKMSDQQRAIVADELERYQVLGKIVAEKAKAIDAGDKEVKVLERQLKLQERVLRAEQEADKKQRIETIEGVQGKGNLLNRRGQQFSGDDINKLNEARSAAGLDNLSEEQTRVLTMDNTQLSGAARDSHMANYQKILAQINAELNQAKATIEQTNFTPLTQSLDQYKAKSEQVGKTLQTLYPQGDQQVSSARFLAEFDKLDAETQEFIKNTVLADQTWEEFLAELDNVGDNSIAVEQLADALGEVRANAAQQVVTDTGLDPESVNATTMAIDDQIDSTLELTHQREQLAKSGEKIDDDMDKFPAKLPTWQDQVVAAASAVSSFSMALTTLGGIWDTLQDPDLTVWEKLGTVFTTLATVVPALVMTWKTLSEAKIKDTIVTAINTAASWANAAAKEGEGEANKKAAGEQIEETLSDAWDTAGKSFKNFCKTVKTGFSNLGKTIKSGASKIGQAIKGVFTKFGSIIVSVGIAVGVAAVIIGGCVLAFKALNDAYNKNEIAAQKAEAAAKNLADAYTETKSSYEELKNTISSYESARDGIAELTRGTAEFGDQISQANDEAMKLLGTYGDLIGNRYSVDSDGLIKIDDDALEEIQQRELDKTQQAQSASVIANQRAREARLKADATKMHRDTIKTQEGFTGEDWNETGKAAAVGTGVGAGVGLAVGAGTAIAGAAAGAAAGSVVPIVGTLIGAAAGLIIGGIAGLITNAVDQNSETDAEKEALNSLAEEYHLKGESALTDDKIKEVYGKDLNDEEIAAIRELCKELNANTVATEAENQAMANQVLSDNEKVQNSRDVDDIGVFAGAAYGKATDEAMKKYMSNDYQAGFFGKGSDVQKKAWARYADAKGLDDLKDYKVTDYRKDGGVEYSYTDEEGKTQKEVITQEEWAAVVAAQDADAAVKESGEKIVDILSTLEEGTVDILTGAKSGDMSALTMGQLGSDNQEIKNMSEEDLHALGFEGTKDEILAQIAEQQQANIENIKLAGAQYGETVSGLINNMIDTNDSTISNVTQGTLKAYADTLNELALHGGENVMKNFDIGLQGIMDKYSNKSEEIMSIANNIDWSQGESALQDFNYQLMQIGINIDEGSAEWEALVKAMSKMNTSVIHQDLESIRSKIADIKELTGEIEIGDVISDEEFDKLIKYKAELADMFIMTADGYQYIGGGDLDELSDKYAKQELQQTKINNAKARAAHDAINNWGWTDGTNFTKEDWYGLANGTDSNKSMNTMTNALLTNESEHIANMGYDTAYLQELSNTLVDPNATKEQIDAAKAILQQFYSDVLTMNENYENDMYVDTKAEEVYASTAENVGELQQMYADGSIGIDTYNKAHQALVNTQIQSAQSLTELQDVVANAGGSYDQETVDNKLIELGNNYKNCADEVKNFEQALLSNNNALIEEARSMLEVSVELNELAEKYDLDAEATANYADRLAGGNAASAEAKRAFGQMAIAAQRLDRGMKNVNENMDDYKKIIKTVDRNSFEFSKTMDDLKKDIADIFNVADGNMFSDVFAEGLLDSEDFKKALDGDIEALNRLRASATVDIGDNIIADLGKQANVLQTEYRNAAGEIVNASFTAQSAWDYIRGVLADGFTLEKINDEKFVESLNQMIQASGMTKEQIQSMLGSMGVSAEVVTGYVQQETEVPTYYDYSVWEGNQDFSYTDDDGTHTIRRPKIKKMTVPGDPVKVMGYVPTYSLKTTSGDTSSGGEIDYSNTFKAASPPAVSSGSTTSGVNNSGGSSKKTSETRTKKSDTVERYKEINDKLEENNRLMERNSIIADTLYGADRLAYLEEEINLLDERSKLLKENIKEAQMYLAEDKASLIKAGEIAGISFTFNEDGNIDNYTQQMVDLYNQRNNLLNSFGDTIDEDEQEKLDNFDKRVDLVKEAYQQYEDTLDKNKDLEKEEIENQIEKQQKRFQKMTEGLEIKLSINKDDLQVVEYSLGKIQDDFYQSMEAAALMLGDTSKSLGTGGGQLGNYLSNLNYYDEYINELETKYANGEITKTDYVEGLRNSQGAIIDNLNSLNELDRTMSDYYGDTVAAAVEELSKFTALQEHSSSVLEHYSNIVSLMGKEQDYKYMQKILDAQVSVAKNSYDAAEEWYEVTQAQAKQKEEEYQKQYDLLSADGNMSEEDWKALEWYEKQWLAAQETANEAEENMLSAHEDYLEKMKAATENALNNMNREYEKSMLKNMFGEDTKYTSFEQINLAMERQSSLQEDILTNTNKKYEIDKLIRKTQQDIDKTTNSVAKKELKAFIERSKAKGEQTELSKTELGILEQEYEVLKAQIALEEAQNAKSTVRLQRDSEGNFGYIYTADEDKVADAQQAYADAENELYNQRLEAANDYGQKIIQTQSELTQTLNDLHSQFLNGEFESEQEYQNAVTAAYDYYYALLEDQQRIYNNIYSDEASWLTEFVSTETDNMKTNVSTNSQLAHDSWVNAFGLMTTNTETWKTNTGDYLKAVKDMLIDGENSYTKRVNKAATDAGLDLDTLANKTETVKTQSENLTKFITDPSTGLIKGLDDEMTKVGELTGEYESLRSKIGELITEYEKLLTGDNSITARLKAAVDALMKDNPIDIPDIDFNINPVLGDDTQFWTAMEERYGFTVDGENVTTGESSTTSLTNDNNYSGSSSFKSEIYNFRPKDKGNPLLKTYGLTEKNLESLQGLTELEEIDKRFQLQEKWRGALSSTDSFSASDGPENSKMINGRRWIRNPETGLWYFYSELEKFDTGGYTGTWDGGYGKLAMLHSKELVLNADETENFLASMELLDNIIKIIDLYSANAQWGGLLSTPTFGNYDSEPLEQNVHIEASFPGVTDKNQIEEAFNDIINLASQYANRKY